jgi:hypothetical protein
MSSAQDAARPNSPLTTATLDMPASQTSAQRAADRKAARDARLARATHAGDSGEQRLRIKVPTAQAEMLLGLADDGQQGVRLRTSADIFRTAKHMNSENEQVRSNSTFALGVDHRGFVGALTTVDHGNYYVCAASWFGSSLGNSYHHAARIGSILELGVNAFRIYLTLWGKSWTGNWSVLTKSLTLGQMTWMGSNALLSPTSGAEAGAGNFDYMKSGHVGMFGARSVKLESLEGVSSSAGLFNSHSAGLSASVNSLLSASVNSGFLTSLNGAYGASINAADAGVIGGVGAQLSSRVGVCKVEGASIRIGNRRQAGAKATYVSGLQERTEDLWLRAHDFIEMGLPSTHQLPETPIDYPKDGHLINHDRPPVGMQILRGMVRTSTDDASVTLSSEVLTLADKSFLKVGINRVTLGRLKAAPMGASTAALLVARRIYNDAWGEAEGVVKQVKSILPSATMASVAATVANVSIFGIATAHAAAAGAVLGAVAADGEEEAGAEAGAKVGAIAGSVVGGVVALTTMMMSAMKTAGVAQRAGQEAAQKAYSAAIKAAVLTEQAPTLDPTAPQVVVADGFVRLSYGPPGPLQSSITLNATGIVINGPKVVINDIEQALPPNVPAPPPLPDLPEPPPVAAPEIPRVPLLLTQVLP